MRVMLSLSSLRQHGGIERLTYSLAAAMSLRGHTVFLAVPDVPSTVPLYSLPEGVKFLYHTYDGDERKLSAFRKTLLSCEPDVCVSLSSHRYHWGWCAALWGSGIPWVYSEHATPAVIEHEEWNRPERLAAMAGADIVHLVRSSCDNALPEDIRRKTRIIPNAMTLPLDEATQREPHLLLSLGRLDVGKQNALLLRAFALLRPEFPEWRLEIWGEGDDEQPLRHLLNELNLSACVSLCGPTIVPQKQYARASIFVMPSRHEAFGLVTVEAQAHGLPVVGFAECEGTAELVQHGITGLLASAMTPEDLAQNLRKLMSDPSLRVSMGANAQVSAQAFLPERVFAAWESLLMEAAACKGQTCLQALSASIHEEARQRYALLKCCIARPNVYLRESDWLRLFIWRRPWLRRLQHMVRKKLGLIS